MEGLISDAAVWFNYYPIEIEIEEPFLLVVTNLCDLQRKNLFYKSHPGLSICSFITAFYMLVCYYGVIKYD